MLERQLPFCVVAKGVSKYETNPFPTKILKIVKHFDAYTKQIVHKTDEFLIYMRSYNYVTRIFTMTDWHEDIKNISCIGIKYQVQRVATGWTTK
jgi:hypothetical protein